MSPLSIEPRYAHHYTRRVKSLRVLEMIILLLLLSPRQDAVDMNMLVFFLGKCDVFGPSQKPWLWTEKTRRY